MARTRFSRQHFSKDINPEAVLHSPDTTRRHDACPALWETVCLLPHLKCAAPHGGSLGHGAAPTEPADLVTTKACTCSLCELHPGLTVDASLAAPAQLQLLQAAAKAEVEVASLRRQRWHRPESPNPFK